MKLLLVAARKRGNLVNFCAGTPRGSVPAWKRRPPHPDGRATTASAGWDARTGRRPGGRVKTRRRYFARRGLRRGTIIRHASALPHAVGTLPIAMIQSSLFAALMTQSCSPRAGDAGSGAAGASAVHLASVVLGAHEELRAAPLAGEHHENLVHTRQPSPPAFGRRSQVAGAPIAWLALPFLPPETSPKDSTRDKRQVVSPGEGNWDEPRILPDLRGS